MKRLALFSLALIVVFSTIVSSPRPSVAADATLANFFPADTFAFADIDTADLPTTIKTISDLMMTIYPSFPANWMDMISQQASQQAGHTMTFEKDIIGWIGSRAAIGIYVPADTFNASLLARSSPDLPKPMAVGLITVKDEALADAFLKLARYTQQTEQVEPVNGEAVTIYTDVSKTKVARWKGYLAVGDVDLVLATLRQKKATLDTDADYQKMVATLKTGTLASIFTRLPIASNSSYVILLALLGPSVGNVFNNIVSSLQGTPTPTPSPTPQPIADETTYADAVRMLGTSIHSVRAEGKNLILESSAWLNPDAVGQLATVLKIPALSEVLLAEPKPLEGSLIDKIPATTAGFIAGTDLKQIYDMTLGFTSAIMAGQQLSSAQHRINGDMLAMFKTQAEMSVHTSLGLSLESDLLPLLDGDFALYMTPNKTGLLNTLARGQFPADSTLLVVPSDADKAQTVLATLNEALSKQMNIKPAEPDAKGLYALSFAPGAGLNFGLVDGTVLLTPNTGVDVATAALAGDGVVSSDPTWTAAAQSLPEQVSQVWYLNGANLRSLLGMIDTSASQSMAAQIQQMDTFIAPFDSALIYYRVAGDGVGETTYILTLK